MLRCPNGGKTQPNRIKKQQALAARLHPRLRNWFFANFPGFTHAQELCLPSVLKRESILLTSPTGSGKTLAGFLGVFDALVRELKAGALKPGVCCVYVSPLRALAYDIEKNLKAPIAGMGLEKKLRIHLRTGDTPASERTKFRNKPSHFLVTTPESLAILLAQQSYAQHLAHTEFVIVDELHSFAGNKRGADLSISLERLQRLRGKNNLCRVGLSATAAPLDLLAQFLVGKNRHCRIAEGRIEKEQIVDVFSPIRSDPYPPSGYTGARLYAELSQLIRSRQSVIVLPMSVRRRNKSVCVCASKCRNWLTRSRFTTLRSIA